MNSATAARPPAGVVGQFLAGVALLPRGLGTYARSPRLIVLGIIPALITGALFVAAYATLAYFVTDVADWLTPFADGWGEDVRQTVRAFAALAVLGVGGLLAVLTFTAVTLVVGDPFYEKISERVEARYGGVPNHVDVSMLRALRRSAADSLRLIVMSVLFGVPLFLAGFIPLVGQTVVPVVGAAVGGWLLALELAGASFQRRGLRLADRRRVLRENRPMALGFGMAVFVSFLIPLGAVLLMPAAVAGAALLTRRCFGQPVDTAPGRQHVERRT